MSPSVSSEAERANALIKLYGAARQRFESLEKLYWKVNFSIWGFFGAVAYFLRGTDKQPMIHTGAWILLLLVFAVFIHFEFLRRINNSASGWRATAEHYRDSALRLLGEHKPNQPTAKDVRRNDFTWICLAPATTALIGTVVAFLFW